MNFVSPLETVCALSAMVQAIQIHTQRGTSMGQDDFDELTFPIASEFAISEDCVELSAAVSALCPGLSAGALTKRSSIQVLGHVTFLGWKWASGQDVMFKGESGLEAARIRAVWDVVPTGDVIFKVDYHSRIFVSPVALGTLVVKVLAGGT